MSSEIDLPPVIMCYITDLLGASFFTWDAIGLD